MLRTAIALSLLAAPAYAADGPFFSLGNTDFVVLLGFIVFCGILVYFGVPGMITGLLDKRAEGIQSELDEAKALREEAQSLLASFERKAKEVEGQAERIVAQAKEDASIGAEQAKKDLEVAIERRLVAAEDRIATAEAGAVKEVKDRAVAIAIDAAASVLKSQKSKSTLSAAADASIEMVKAKLH
ncbi:MAG: F0F1 ATP synthase subunit B [Pseudomonadota bacterium]